MKTIICVVLSMLCVSCVGQRVHDGNKKKTEESLLKDTLFILPLKNRQYEQLDYKILRLCNLDSERNQIKSTRRIELIRGNKAVASLSLPVPDEEVKNFSVNEITETEKGFKIVVNWGGGNYFYGREFYFNFKDTQFYLDSLIMKSYIQEPEKEIMSTKSIMPPIPINRVKILEYLENK